jgi:hypothetical protein
MGLIVTPLTPAFRLCLEESSATPPALVAVIEQIWAAEQARRGGRLHNGTMLSFVRNDADCLYARRTDYRHFIAQRREPRLFAELQLRTLAVSGLARSPLELLLGRRSGKVTQDAGRWELVPSGGLSPSAGGSDVASAAMVFEQCYVELEEETGIPRSSVDSAQAFALVEDPEAHVIDIGVELSMRDFLATGEASTEYERLLPVPIDAIADFCRDHDVIPVSRALLEARGLLPAL